MFHRSRGVVEGPESQKRPEVEEEAIILDKSVNLSKELDAPRIRVQGAASGRKLLKGD